MNRILRFIYAALIVSTAVACHTSEIDNPNNDNQDKPKAYDNIILTASIKQTRVDYSINGDKLEQRWAEGDAIYGFYGGDETNKIVFTVESVDDETGVASLYPEFGWSGFLSAYKANNNLAVGLVYTGCTTSEISSDFYNYSTIEVDMTSQKTERIPACMHASTYSDRTEDDITYIQFKFDNDCSIIEVFSFTGVKEDRDDYFDGDSATLGDITVDGLIEGCKYSLYKGVLQFEPIDKTDDGDAPTKVTLGDSWSVTKDGDITYDGDIKPVFIAVVPSEYTNFTVSANLNGGKKPISQPFENKLFEKGNSYYIMANPVVAKTADNVYFKTVYDAFEHAEELSDRYTTAADNVVTLINKEIDGFGDVSEIEIDYPVTLDLNGCTLSLDGSEGFQITFNKEWIPGELIITDSAPLDKDGKYVGTINSSSTNPMIINSGTVTIDGGNLSYKFIDGETYDYSYYSMIYNSGTLSIDNASFLESYGSPEQDDENFYIINNEGGTLNIIDGLLNSFDNIHSLGNVGTVTISGGTITSTDVSAIVNDGELTVSGDDTEITSTKGKAISNDGKVIINGGTITSVGDSAIGNSGSLTVNAGTVSSAQSSAIYSDGYEIIIGQTGSPIISSPNNFSYLGCYYSNDEEQYCAAIFIEYFGDDIATFTMYGGTVTGDNHAIAMNGPVEAEIKGGNFSSSFRTLLVADGAQCNISGGQFYCSSTKDPTVYCFCENEEIEGTSLTITECEDNNRKEPLFYSLAETDDIGRNITFAAPICATLNGNDRINYSSVTIAGGYYYSSGAFLYCGNEGVLTIPSEATLYSNVNRIGYRDARGGVEDYTISSLPSSFSVPFFALEDQVEFTYELTQ